MLAASVTCQLGERGTVVPEAPSDAGSQLPPRYRDVAPLGEGAFGRVYRATDDQGRACAVKVLAAELAATPAIAWQFAAEHRQLARLDHPAFPQAFEEGRTPAGLPFYSMALVPGGPVPAGPRPPSEVRAVLKEVAQALTYLHGLGLVHGDLKRENVVLDPHGRVHVLDVGLMAPVGQAREAISGTLEYLAPEAFRKHPVEPASDLYALGVLGYELRGGRPPFTGSPAELLRGHLQTPPASIQSPVADAGLDQLIMSLLAKEPSARPASAWQVLAALGENVEPQRLVAGGGLRGGGFIGRSEALAAWGELLAARRGFLVLTGGQGLGKSRALDEGRLAAQVAGLAWAGASCAGAGDAPAASARAVLGQALAAADVTPGADLASWLVGGLSPRLTRLEPASRKAVVFAAAAEALQAAAEALAARGGGLAIALDDWHLADVASRDLLRHLRAATADAAIAWLATAGEGHEEAGATVVALAPLDAAECEALLAGRLGGPVPLALLNRLTAMVQGAPLLLHLGLEHLVALGALRRDAKGWTFDADAAGADALAGGLRSIWQARLASLSGRARRLLAVAAAGAPAGALPVPLLARVAGLDEATGAAAADALAAAGAAIPEAGCLRLVVPGLAELALEPVASGERADWAEALATAVLDPAGRGLAKPSASAAAALASGGIAPAALADVPLDRLVAAAWIWLGGGRAAPATTAASEAHVVALEAARRSLELAAPAEAWRLLEAAADLGAEPVRAAHRGAYTWARAEAGRLLDRLEPAAADYAEACERAEAAGDHPRTIMALIGEAKCRQMKGDYVVATVRLLAAADHAATHKLGDLEARARVALARVRLFAGEPASAQAECRRAAELAEAAGATALRAQALNFLGVLVGQEDLQRQPEGLALIEQGLALAREAGDRLAEGACAENLGNIYLTAGELAKAAEAFRAAHAVMAGSGAATEALAARLNEAIVEADRVPGPGAAALAAEVAARAGHIGRKFFVGAARAAEGTIAWRLGRPAQAFAPLDEALAIATEIRNKYLEEHVRIARLEALIAVGSLAEAMEEAGRAQALVDKSGHAEAQAKLAALRADLARLSSDPAGARTLAGPLRIAPNRQVSRAARRVLAELRLADGDAQGALEDAHAAAQIAMAWDAPWHLAADSALAARALLALGRREQALDTARGVVDDPSHANPYATASAAKVLVDAQAPEGQAILDEAVDALRPGLLSLGDAAWRRALLAHGLGDLQHKLDRRQEAQVSSWHAAAHVDPARFGRFVGGLSLQPDETAIGRFALHAAMALAGAERGYALIYEDGQLRQAITHELDYATEVAAGFSHSIAEQVLFAGEPLYVADAMADTTWKEAASVMALGLRTVIALPLSTPEEILGVLYMDRQAIDPLLTSTDVAWLHAFATAAAGQIVRERARAEAAGRAERMGAAASLAARVAAEPDPLAARREVLAAALAAAGAERAFWLEPAGTGWDARAALQADGKPFAFRPDMVSAGIADWVRARGEPLGILDAGSAEDWQARKSVQALGLRTVWCVPVRDPAGALVYLDTGAIAHADPAAALRAVEELVGRIAPLVRCGAG